MEKQSKGQKTGVLKSAKTINYLQLPKVLFSKTKFSNLSLSSKVLYAFLLDRQRLSRKNQWIDQDGNAFVYFTVNEICQKLGVGKSKASILLTDLEKASLITRKKQGNGRPCYIYIENIVDVLDNKRCGAGENARPVL